MQSRDATGPAASERESLFKCFSPPTAFYPLPTGLLPTADCLLPTAYFLLRMAFSAALLPWRMQSEMPIPE